MFSGGWRGGGKGGRGQHVRETDVVLFLLEGCRPR